MKRWICCLTRKSRQTQFQRLQTLCTENKISVEGRIQTATREMNIYTSHNVALMEEQARVLQTHAAGRLSKGELRSVLGRILTEQTVVKKNLLLWSTQYAVCVKELHKVNRSVTQLQILASNKADKSLLSAISVEDLKLLDMSSSRRAQADDQKSLLFDSISNAVDSVLESDSDVETEEQTLDMTERLENDGTHYSRIESIIMDYSIQTLPDVPNADIMPNSNVSLYNSCMQSY
jgi:hypothetical protein